MSFLKIKLLVIAAIVFAASSAFASLSYEVTVDTSSLSATDGYLYMNYAPLMYAGASTATVSNFVTDGALLSANDTSSIANGSAVSGMLPGQLVFGNSNGSNDYNHGIHFGSSLSFLVTFSTPTGGRTGGASEFTLALASDVSGTPIFATDGSGSLVKISLLNDGTITSQILAPQADATPTPLPAAAWLLGSGLMGLCGIKRRKA
jgi:hypothetical protein